ncbi:hypothetical protein BJ508DRAFT_412972 [Ascobolus immersus RN42]|uniref:EngB-type G domain-containing protein n=1 Tax=Ascobolus immersus RN42 TaxID=1160509 RepID=A0A3N4IQQ4_ASCIM|nr:hypothetical protein BJ508DRAFT_412972 [Ascobolus immersus RN42]
MPGYGHGSKMAWGAEILKYLGNRRVFRRVFLLIDAMVGINKKDVVMIEYLKTLGISFQVVVNKCDKIAPGELRERMEGVKRELERVGATNVLGEILGVSAEPKKKDRRKFGVDAFRWAVLKACGLENEEAVIKDLKVEIKVDKEVKGEKKKAATPRKEKEWVYTKVEREKKEKEEREREERALEEEEWEEEMEERREREASRGRPKYRK